MKKYSVYDNQIFWCLLLIFIASVLSCFPILVLEDGGSWTFFSLLPLWLITYFFGTKTGLIWSYIFCFIKMFATFISEIPGDYFSTNQNDYHFFGSIFTEDLFYIPWLNNTHLALPNNVCVVLLEYVIACSLFCIGGFLKSNRKCENYIDSVKLLRRIKENEKNNKLKNVSVTNCSKIAFGKELDKLNNYIDNYYEPLPTQVMVDINKENTSTGLVWGYIWGVFCMFVCYVISSYLFYQENNFAGPFPFNLDRLIYDIKYDGSYLLVEAITTIIILEVPAVQKVIFRIKHIANNPKDNPSIHSF